MIGTRTRKILRDIMSRKARTALVCISIFVGVFGTITFFTMGDLLVRQLKDDLDQDSLAMVRSYVAPNPTKPINNEQAILDLQAIPDVTIAEGQSVNTLFWKKEGETSFRSSSIFGYSVPLQDIQLEPMRLETGNFPQPGNRELVVERRFAEQYDLAIDDEITVSVLSRAARDSETVPEEPWTIVGIVFFPYTYQGNFNLILPEDSVFAAHEDVDYLTGSAAFSSFYLRFSDYESAEAQLDTFRSVLRSETSYIEIFTMTEDPAENNLIKSAQTIGNVLATLALLALIVSGFLVVNVISSIITEQKQQIGAMKSLGATQSDNLKMYLGMALLYGIIGVIPAVIIGIPAGYFTATGVAATSSTEISEFGISVRAIVFGIVMGLAVPILAAIIPVLNGTRVRIIDAITDRGIDSSYGSGPVARLIAALPIPINMRQGISNILRKKGRMIFTTITLTVAVGAFMGIFAVFTSINAVLNDFFNTYQYNLSAAPREGTDMANFEELLVNEVDGLSSDGPFVAMAIEIEGYDKEYDPSSGPPALFANGYDPEQLPFDLIIEDGSPLTADSDQIIISSSIATATGHGPGDEVVIHGGGNQGTYKISGVANFPYDQVWFNWSTLSELAGYVDENGEAVPQGYYLSVAKSDPSAADVDEVIDDINAVLQDNGITASYGNIEQFTETLTSLIAMFQAIFNFAAGLIALVGAVGLLSTLSMSVFERQKEIGVMRSIGAPSSTIIGQFLTEGIVVGFVAWLIGLPLGYFLSKGLIAGLNLGEEYNLGFPVEAVIVGLVGMIIITTLASIWPSMVAARKTVSDILRYQ
jgi:putative ABC transport system permease protein